MISQSRWDWVIKEIENVVTESMFVYEDTLLKKEELDLAINVLKNNTPFQVVPDCCFGKKPNKETIEAMNDVLLETNNVVLETSNVLLETQHFKVLGDKE